MSADPPLLRERRKSVTIVSASDPPSNRMTLELAKQLGRVIGEFAFDDSVRALVFTAEDAGNDSVGMDLKQLPEGTKQKGGADAETDL
jgi:enoyl-CoA hydratase